MYFNHQSHLLSIQDDAGSREITLDNSIYTIGRDPSCDIRLLSQFASRRHATLIQLPNEDGSFSYRIVDGVPRGKLSANGLMINGHKLQAHDLQHGDEIVFGPSARAIYYQSGQCAAMKIPVDDIGITLISGG